MEVSRIEVIFLMGLMALAVRALPQLVFVARPFPERWDRLLRYLSYAFICSIISVTLFMTGGAFEAHALPYRGSALAVAVLIAHRTKSAVSGMLTGTLLVLALSWLR